MQQIIFSVGNDILLEILLMSQKLIANSLKPVDKQRSLLCVCEASPKDSAVPFRVTCHECLKANLSRISK